MPNRTSCPSPETLRQFALGELPEEDITALQAHLSSCEQCLGRLQDLSAGDGLADALRQMRTISSGARQTKEAQQLVLNESPATPPGAAALEPTGGESPAVADNIPERIARYRILKVLGRGGFGVVYLTRDEQLSRNVAIKVPHPHQVAKPQAVDAYLAEARIVANLDHPYIVPVYDSGSTDECPLYIVSKYIEGSTLAERIQGWPTVESAAELIAKVANALHYAHRQGLVHRDIKPNNILLDTAGKPYVADFGLALKEEAFGTGPKLAGTPAYMSPEQAREEGHRVDGRSDIFSLGVVFYEMLTGRRPFPGGSTLELLEQIANLDPRPPRQIKDCIPKELERICLKALSKKATDRYTTAQDMGDDLQHFLSKPAGESSSLRGAPVGQISLSARQAGMSAPREGVSTPSDQRPIKIVPKGLRSFDAHDADFFLELLPGPRDRDGLPDSIRFWKTRIEEADADQSFAVGLIYGPSGCGKSSLVKAGLLPRLADRVQTVYIEATGQDTETRLLHGLRKRCPALPANLTLRDTLAALRRGTPSPPTPLPRAGEGSKKILIVLDQFEQWLHANRDKENSELVQALRQCDGEHVQCIVMVRDDFWLAVSRFLRELEIRLVEGQNSALVDLFDTDHARKILAAFGRAFGKLPVNPAETTNEQKEFLDQAIAGLSQEGKVVCVRLALFADMFKTKPWTPAALKAVGGTAGVGVTFLEETFSAKTAPPEHRYHQKAARAVLKALLPETGSDIKGHMRSQAELLEASGYASRPKDFADLMHILDSELRLVTPTDPEGVDEEHSQRAATPQRAAGFIPAEGPDPAAGPVAHGGDEPRRSFYQLTHDYLVHSLRDWLTRKQRETPRGRAELRLAERAAAYRAKPERRHLPAPWEWFNIRLFTRKKNWSESERDLMRKAARFHFFFGSLIVLFPSAVFMAMLIVAKESQGRNASHYLHRRLLEAKTEEVARIVKEMPPYRRWLDPLLRQTYAEVERNPDPTPAMWRHQLHAALGLLPTEQAHGEYLLGRLLGGNPQEITSIREALFEHTETNRWTERLWTLLVNPKMDLDERFRAACALAVFDPRSSRWETVSSDIAAKLITQEPLIVGHWTEALQPVGKFLLPPLTSFLDDERRDVKELLLVGTVYDRFASDHPEAIVELEQRLAEESPPNTTDASKISLAKRQTNIAVALLAMRRGQKAWSLLAHGPDPTRRSFLMERLAAAGIPPEILLGRLAGPGVPLPPEIDRSSLLLSSEEYWAKEQPRTAKGRAETSIHRAILLSLGEYGIDRLATAERKSMLPRLLQIYRDHSDPGIHGAAEWLIRRFDAADQIQNIDKDLATGKVEGKRQWYINKQGQTFVIVPKPAKVWLGEGPERKLHRTGSSFAIASKEVTVEQFLKFRENNPLFQNLFSPTDDCPMNSVTWFEAAEYCNWLSEKEGIPKDQWCYEPNKDGKYAKGMKIAPYYLQLTGYRLPTEWEWEYACRAGSETSFAFGQAEELIGSYGWHVGNSAGPNHPTGSLKPNDLGLFDMHGNAWEWTDSRFDMNKITKYGETISRKDVGNDNRSGRGGSVNSQPVYLRASYRYRNEPAYRYYNLGFRPARTLPVVAPEPIKTDPHEGTDTILDIGNEGCKVAGQAREDLPKIKFTPSPYSMELRELPAHLYRVKLIAGKTYKITLESEDVEAVLVLQDEAGKQLAWDDDSGENLNALIRFNCPKDDVYRIYAGALKGSGAFTLKIVEADK